MIVGVVADDITGANDIGIMFAKAGYMSEVWTWPEGLEAGPMPIESAAQEPDVLILDTHSRLDPPDLAYRKVRSATRALQAAGCGRFFKKTCSVFRGNIGAEFDAMLDALGEEFAVVVLGFPKNGRVTLDGIHYVHGQRLEDSEFRHDPIHPMTRSSLVEILQSQTRRTVGLLNQEVVAQGTEALREHIGRMRSSCHYLILDVVDQRALATIAAAVHDLPILCGSSALAEELPAAWEARPQTQAAAVLPPRDGLGVLCAAGSLMPQTAAQIRHLRQRGTATFELSPLRLFETEERSAEIDGLVGQVVARLRAGEDALFHSVQDRRGIEAVRAEGLRRGLATAEVSRMVSEAIAEAVARAAGACQLSRLVIAGGETSAAACARLGMDRLRVWKEIQPGLPSCLSLRGRPMLCVLKSGSFGKPDFFERAIEHLRSQ